MGVLKVVQCQIGFNGPKRTTYRVACAAWPDEAVSSVSTLLAALGRREAYEASSVNEPRELHDGLVVWVAVRKAASGFRREAYVM